MSRIIVFAIVLSLPLCCRAQIVLSCYNGKPDTSTCATIVARALKSGKSGLRYKNAPVEICSLDGYFTLVFGINERYRKASFQLDCEEISSTKPFNNKQNGLKQGLWFKTNLLGKVQRAVKYDSGQVKSLLTFWPNGLPKRFIKYKSSGKPVLGGTESYEKR